MARFGPDRVGKAGCLIIGNVGLADREGRLIVSGRHGLPYPGPDQVESFTK